MILIIGGGTFGLSIGWYLAGRGAAVTILERDRAGYSATWAAAGMLMPWKLSASFSEALFALQCASYHRWPDFAAALSEASNHDLDYQQPGRYFAALSERVEKRLAQQVDYHRSLGWSLTWLKGKALREQEPELGPEIRAAAFSPLARQVDNHRLAQALRTAVLQAGVTLREHTAVESLWLEGGHLRGVRLAGGETLLGKTVIVAAGAWSSQLAGLPQGYQNKIKPRKGQSIILQMPPKAPLLTTQAMGPVYLVPRTDGRLVIGTTMEREAGFSTTSTAGGVQDILRRAELMLPAVLDLPIVQLSAGLRPTGPNRQPVLGHTELPGLIFASGGHSYGILLTPIIAESISQLVLDGQINPLIAQFVR